MTTQSRPDGAFQARQGLPAQKSTWRPRSQTAGARLCEIRASFIPLHLPPSQGRRFCLLHTFRLCLGLMPGVKPAILLRVVPDNDAQLSWSTLPTSW